MTMSNDLAGYFCSAFGKCKIHSPYIYIQLNPLPDYRNINHMCLRVRCWRCGRKNAHNLLHIYRVWGCVIKNENDKLSVCHRVSHIQKGNLRIFGRRIKLSEFSNLPSEIRVSVMMMTAFPQKRSRV